MTRQDWLAVVAIAVTLAAASFIAAVLVTEAPQHHHRAPEPVTVTREPWRT